MMVDLSCLSSAPRDGILLATPAELRPHEEYLAERLDEVGCEVIRLRVWTVPLLVERHTLIVMDGHHRLAFALREGLFRVPCLLTDYETVSVESRHPGLSVTPAEIIRRGISGNLYPPKTTRHTIPAWLKCTCSFSLEPLGEARPGEVDARRWQAVDVRNPRAGSR